MVSIWTIANFWAVGLSIISLTCFKIESNSMISKFNMNFGIGSAFIALFFILSTYKLWNLYSLPREDSLAQSLSAEVDDEELLDE
jgi:hypothetical protein